MKTILTLLLLITVLAPLPARADSDDDNHHRRVDLDAAIARGEVLPLSKILDKVLPQIKGRIVEIEFEYEKGRPIYELYIINGDGRRLEYEIDARTAEILGLEDED
ncbi:PepSY domain-containing protein [Hoeflea sp.]|uniref:PepSY domain-containing protein n=1 Tax=Hoeflea sp. TaxID=1940281 RepID=UPI003A8ECBAF